MRKVQKSQTENRGAMQCMAHRLFGKVGSTMVLTSLTMLGWVGVALDYSPSPQPSHPPTPPPKKKKSGKEKKRKGKRNGHIKLYFFLQIHFSNVKTDERSDGGNELIPMGCYFNLASNINIMFTETSTSIL